MQYHFCARTDTGRTRANNEDAVVFDAQTSSLVLADGMGGYNAGEVASGMATATILESLSTWLASVGVMAQGSEVRRAMQASVDQANRAVYDAAHANAQYAGMGTTVVVGVFHAGVFWVGHIGDSRCYRLRGGTLERITRDHSLLQDRLDAGLISPAQAVHSRIRNLVTRALGVDKSVVLEVNDFAVAPGDMYLVCSDGLSDMLDDAAIAQITTQPLGLEHKAGALVNAANAKGGKDNISVLLVEVGAAPDPSLGQQASPC
ncbi:Stp1/IreP family PP2C-type Ser/Thr phosphatase [Rhodoferax sp.]|jgi:protein phosphatase|uniref:Stp1/IreP family PP2C-type Ser/Thr phosphatase n=1 Tax=Rhodoferax sp. TaxID=50421 RepID=UPI0037839E80